MIRTVVIALDNSDLSARALPFAEAIAQRWTGHLVLVNAVDHGGHASHVPRLELERVVQELRDRGIDADAMVRVAAPAQAIADVAREQDADLIVMASHQRHGVNRWLNGSVTEEVLTRTPTPLLVVPARSQASRASSLRVLVPLDGTPTGEAPLQFYREHGTSVPLELLLMHIIPVGPVLVGTDPTFTVDPLTPDVIEVQSQQARDYLTALIPTLDDPRISARQQVIEATEPTGRVILDVARESRVDVIALGTHARAGVSLLVLGSVSEEVLERSHVPVLLVRAVDR
jgi:universal stress protein E